MAADDNTRVLLYDNDALGATLIINNFAKTNMAHHMRHMTSSESVLRYLKSTIENTASDKSEKPHLIIFNVDNLDDDCKNILTFIKTDKILKRIPVLIFSSRDDNSSIETAFQYKVNSYLIKPTDSDEFAKVVYEVANYWLKWNQLSP